MVLAQDHNQKPRKCTKCGGEFPATPEYFYRASSGRDGLHSWCKGCQRSNNRAWREANPDRYREWYQANIDKERERQREWQTANREHVRQRLRNWRKANPKRKHAYDKKWREANPDYHREYSNRPEIKARTAVYAHNRRARELSLRNDFTIPQREFAIEYFDHCCAYCGRQFYDLFGNHALAFDHFVPISSPECPGTTVTNMLPTCHGLDGCNSRKGNSDPVEWVIKRFGKRKGRMILSRIADYFEIANSRWFTADTETKSWH